MVFFIEGYSVSFIMKILRSCGPTESKLGKRNFQLLLLAAEL
jgi:hypothetical protein